MSDRIYIINFLQKLGVNLGFGGVLVEIHYWNDTHQLTLINTIPLRHFSWPGMLAILLTVQ